MRRYITLALIGFALLSCAQAVSAQHTDTLYRAPVRFVRPTRVTADSVCYRVLTSEASPTTIGRVYCSTRKGWTDARWIPYPGPMPDLSVLDAPQPQPTPPAPPTQPPPSSDPAGALYADNFDNGRRGSGNGFSWAGGDSDVTISSDRAYSGQYSMRFRFGPDAPGEDSSAEERFFFPRAPEVWIEFMLWIPSDYVHRNDSPGNNKLFALWGGGGDAYGRSGRAKVVIELWPIAGNDSQFRFLYNPAGSGTSHSLEWISPAISANGPMRRGQWNRFRYYVKVGSGPNHGVVKAWVGDQLVYSNTQVDLYPSPANAPYFDTGYLMGWSNSGFTDVTDFYVDDFRLYAQNPGW